MFKRAVVTSAVLMMVSTSGWADYVGSLTTRIFLDPATVPAIIDGYQNGDEIAYILETTPRDTGSTNGVAAWMTLYVPAGVEVIGASFVSQAGDGTWVDIPAEDGDICWLDCGQRSCNRYDLVSGSLRIDDGAISEVNHDSGIFYSTDPRTANNVTLLTPSVQVTGADTKPAEIYNQWDYDQCRAFGMKKLGGVKTDALSGNSGKGNTPVISLDSGSTWAGTGSMVAGPDTFYTNDYNPACDCNGSCPGSSDFKDDIQCVGPWNRIAYPNSKLADAAPVVPSTTASFIVGNTSVVTAAGVALSSASPLPTATNAIRWVHGQRTLGDIEHGRVAFRITDVAAFLATFTDDTFCLESTGGDTSDIRGKDNAFRYYEPEHKCFDDLGGPGANGVLLKQVLFVDGNSASGAFLAAGDVISWQVTFTNTSGGALTNILFEDTPDLNVTLVEPGAETACAYGSYDGDLPGPSYNAGSITSTGTATWAAIPSLAAGGSVTVSLCGKVSAAVADGDLVKNTAKVTYTLPSSSTEIQTSTTTGIVADCLLNIDCDDGDACNGAETCVSGDCIPGTPVTCNDGVGCTVDACDLQTGLCSHTPQDSLCSNNLFCDGLETCDPTNDCQAGTPPDCSDTVACTVDSCDEVNDQCVNAPTDSVCDNNQFCDGLETCDPINDCQAGTPPNCDDGVACTVDSCDEVNDVCVNTADDASCSNGNPCDGIEVCHPLTDCGPGTPPDCDDGVACTVDSCDPNTGQCVHTTDDSLCDNGLFCDGSETCDALSGCQAGTPPVCDDGVVCTIDTCDEANDVCVNTPSDAVCNNNQYCDGVETCHPVNDCQAGTPPNCDDAVTCTVDSCDEVNDVCVHGADDSLCDNNQYCDGVETCDPVSDCQAGKPPKCDDGVSCTVDSCDEANDVCAHAPDDNLCNNKQFCDGVETCDALSDCQPGTPPNCDDAVGCTVDACDETNDVCVHAPTDSICDDTQFCNGVETCDPTNDCQAGTPPNCNDGVGCTNDSCDEINDVCVNAPDDGLCNDTLFCNGEETCDAINDCQAGTPPDCDDGVGCTMDSCDEFKGCVSIPSNSLCNDGAFCNGVETCDADFDCQAGTPPNCDDGVGCTVDSCDEVNDTCVNAANDSLCDDTQFCDGVETCSPINDCQPGTPPNCNDGVGCTNDSCDEVNDVCVNTADNSLCDNGQFCDGVETCNAISDCQAGTPPNCADAVACTVDTCDETNDVCVNAPDNAACGDGVGCTVDVCDPVDGCQNTPDDSLCNNNQFCDGVETCDAVGDCQAGTAPNCDDGVPCTTDACDEVNDVCSNTNNDAACDDAVACTNDACDPGNPNANADGCTFTPDDSNCVDGVFCDGVEFCDPINDCVEPGDPCVPPLLCDEGIDMCVDCILNSDCDDGNACNGTETCVASVCVPGTPVDCNDGVGCTVDACIPSDGSCIHTPDHGLCDNGLICDGDEICDLINDCGPGVPVDCDDGVGCTVDSCDEFKGCVSTPNNSLCNDGAFCNGVETCDPDLDCQAGTPPNCDDGVGCTVDSCDEVNDTCVNAPDDSACNDSQFCNGLEICNPVSDCQAGMPPNCDDGVGCTVDSCDEVNDTCVNAPDDSVCNDNQFCNGLETCSAISDCQAGTPPNCDDGVGCTVDSCDEVNDTCVNAPNDGVCDDSQFCNGLETCSAINDCQAGTPPNCNDGVGCTVDSCDEVNDTCVNAPDDGLCNDSQFCNGVETCDAINDCQPGTPPDCSDPITCTVDSCDEINDTCVNSPDNGLCSNGQFCDGMETCDPANDCQPGTPPHCDDSVGCTVDSCDEVNDVCVSNPDNTQCDNGLFCDGEEVCNPLTDCQPGAPPDCDDGVGCTEDTCDEFKGCVSTPNDTLCNNGLFCDGVETCDPDLDCQPGTPPDCTDPIGCTLDSCDEVNDTCVHNPDDGLCSNGQFCDGVETCDPINDCQPGTPVDCSDNVGCTNDSCDEAVDDCVNVPDKSLCTNNDPCDGIEVCDPLNDCQPGTPPDCDDNVSCTVDGCDPLTGQCTHDPQDSLCDNGDFCDGVETCDPINDCQPGTPPDCADTVGCTVDSCDEVNDECVHAPNDSLCDNGQYCDGVETCDPIADCQPGTGPDCSDGIFCTVDECDEANDRCVSAPDDTRCEDGDPCTLNECRIPGGCASTPLCGACCIRGGACFELMTEAQCTAADGIQFRGIGSVCMGDADGDGVDDGCPKIIPTMSEWGLVILTLVLLAAAKIYFGTRRPATVTIR